MKCCPHCFADTFLNSRIENMSNEKGQCSYCEAKNVTLIEPEALTDYFEALLDIYIKDINGKPLNALIQDDWATFAAIEGSVQQNLLKAIMRISKTTDFKYSPKHKRNESIIAQWHSFTEELKFKNRFIPYGAPPKDLFVQFGELLGVIYPKLSQKFFRARINEEGRKFRIKDLHKPPANEVLNGRANPIGIPYLYVASTPKTAIAELRGHKGEFVSVLEFEIKAMIELFDLRHPRQTISPFERIDSLEFIYKHMPYLELLGHELSKPVVPKKANLEYLASQYLCELIKQMGYHGIIYKSSIDTGNNYVIFNDQRLKAGKICEYKISEMKVETILVT
jgi:hypothetical protein